MTRAGHKWLCLCMCRTPLTVSPLLPASQLFHVSFNFPNHCHAHRPLLKSLSRSSRSLVLYSAGNPRAVNSEEPSTDGASAVIDEEASNAGPAESYPDTVAALFRKKDCELKRFLASRLGSPDEAQEVA